MKTTEAKRKTAANTKIKKETTRPKPIGALDALKALETIATIKKKVTAKKPLIEKEQPWTEEERAIFKKKVEFAIKESPTVNPADEMLAKEIAAFLECLKDYNLKNNRMPEAIESHCDISDLDEIVNLAAYGLKPARGNWLIVDLGSKQKNEVFQEVIKEALLEHNPRLVLPSLSPIGFLTHINSILKLIEQEGPERAKSASKRIQNHAKLLSYACMAYLEIIDEESQPPCPDVDDEPMDWDSRKKKLGGINSATAWLKAELLNQSKAAIVDKEVIDISEETISSKINFSGMGNLTNHEAIAISSRIAEELLIPYKQKRKRESLFKLRAALASKVFEQVKKHRKKELSENDRILPEKPRYKTNCLWFVRNTKDLRQEVLPVETSTNIYYWGNPNSEKDLHAIIPIIKPKKMWKINIDREEIKTKIIENQSWLSWFAVGVLSLIIAFGLKPSTSQKGEKSIDKPTATKVIKKQDVEVGN